MILACVTNYFVSLSTFVLYISISILNSGLQIFSTEFKNIFTSQKVAKPNRFTQVFFPNILNIIKINKELKK